MNARGLCRGVLTAFFVGCVAVHAVCAQATRRLSVTTLEAGVNSGRTGTESRFLIISKPEVFDEFHGQTASLRLPRPPTPVVDFATHRIVVAVMGEKPTAGYGIRFAESAQRQDRTIEVHVLRTSPAQGAALAQVVTNPYVIAIVARDGYTSVTFVDESGAVLARVDTRE